jgi:hypothetical protein
MCRARTLEAVQTGNLLLRIRPVAVSEAWVVGRDRVEAVGEPGEERREHARGGGRLVQREQRRRVGGAGLVVKDGLPINRDRAVIHELVHGAYCPYAATSKMMSSSTGAPSGRLATP